MLSFSSKESPPSIGLYKISWKRTSQKNTLMLNREKRMGFSPWNFLRNIKLKSRLSKKAICSCKFPILRKIKRSCADFFLPNSRKLPIISVAGFCPSQDSRVPHPPGQVLSFVLQKSTLNGKVHLQIRICTKIGTVWIGSVSNQTALGVFL